MVLTQCSIVQIIHCDLGLKCHVRLPTRFRMYCIREPYSYTYILQGSVATLLRCGAMFNNQFIAFITIYGNDKVRCFFLGHSVCSTFYAPPGKKCVRRWIRRRPSLLWFLEWRTCQLQDLEGSDANNDDKLTTCRYTSGHARHVVIRLDHRSMGWTRLGAVLRAVLYVVVTL